MILSKDSWSNKNLIILKVIWRPFLVTVLDLTYLAILMKNGVKNTQFQIKAKLEMGGSNDLAGCLELLEDQGFKAEHQLLVALFSCINEYCKQEKMRKASMSSPPCDIDKTGVKI